MDNVTRQTLSDNSTEGTRTIFAQFEDINGLKSSVISDILLWIFTRHSMHPLSSTMMIHLKDSERIIILEQIPSIPITSI